MIFGFKDSLRQAVEAASGGLATLVYTPKGQPLFMRRITPFRLEDLAPDGSLGTGWHPAFVDGREFWVSMYRITVHDNEPLSVPGVALSRRTPAQWLDLPKPPGMTLASIWDFAALALMGTKLLGDVLRGNGDWGRARDYPWETGVRADGRAPGEPTGDGLVLNGSGPITWRHDHTPYGVELLGNEVLWVTGVRLVAGEIHVHPDPRAQLNPFSTPNSMWYAWAPDGSLVPASSSGPKLGYSPSGRVTTNRVSDGTNVVFSFASIAPDTGLAIPPLMCAAGLAPSLYSRGNVVLRDQWTQPISVTFGMHYQNENPAPGRIHRHLDGWACSVLLVYRE